MLPFAVIGVGAILAYTMTQGPRNTLRIQGPDGHSYEMQNLPEKEKAVKLLSEIRESLVKLHTHPIQKTKVKRLWSVCETRHVHRPIH